MRKLLEAVIFASLAVALHAAALLHLPETGSDARGTGGTGGEALVSLVAVSGDLETIVAEWMAPPEAQVDTDRVDQPIVAEISDAPESAPIQPVSRLAAPRAVMELAAPDQAELPKLDTAPPALTPPNPAPAPEPAAHPKPQPKASQMVAAGTGGSAQSGSGRKTVQATLTDGERARLLSTWGAEVRNRVERRKTYPRGQRGSYSVRLRLTLSRGGQLLAVQVITPSGNNTFDAAALEAAKKAGRFPPAPKRLTGDKHYFTLTMRFRR